MSRTTLRVGDVTFHQFDPFDSPHITTAPGVILIEDIVKGGYGLTRSNCLKTRIGRIRAGYIGEVLEQRYPDNWQNKVKCWFAYCVKTERGYIAPKIMHRRIESILGDQILSRNLLNVKNGGTHIVKFTHRDTGQYFVTHSNVTIRGVDLLSKLSKVKPDTETKLGKFIYVHGPGLSIDEFSRLSLKVGTTDGRVTNAVRNLIAKYGMTHCLSHTVQEGQLLSLL